MKGSSAAVRINTKELVLTAAAAAIICVLAPWKIPVEPIPITLATFAIYLISAVFGWAKGSAATAVYILLGAVGAPVFSGFMGGFHVISGVTGGYIIGYIPLAFITGLISSKLRGIIGCAAGMTAGTVLLYLFGTAWYCLFAGVGVASAIAGCVLPFIGFDAVKIVMASVLAVRIRESLDRLS